MFLFCLCLNVVTEQNYDPTNSLPTPSDPPSLGPPFTIISRVLNYAPLALPDPFNGFDDVNVSATQNIPGTPFYNQCLRVTSTQNIPPVGVSAGWYVCDYLMDDDGTDLCSFHGLTTATQ